MGVICVELRSQDDLVALDSVPQGRTLPHTLVVGQRGTYRFHCRLDLLVGHHYSHLPRILF